MRRIVLAFACLLGLASPGLAQTFPGDFAPGQVFGNGTPSTGVGGPTSLSSVVDQAACATNNKAFVRLAGVWTCTDFSPSGIDQNSVKVTAAATYTILTTDCGARIRADTGSTAQQIIVLPVVAGFAANCRVSVVNGDTNRGKILSGFPTVAPGILWPGQEIDVAIVGGVWTVIANPGRWKLVGAATFNVNPSTGNDGNDGLGTGSAFATMQKCWDVIVDQLDLRAWPVTCLSAASATYTNDGITTYKAAVGQGNETVDGTGKVTACSITIDGNGSTFNRADGGIIFLTGSYSAGLGGAPGARFCVRRMTLTGASGAVGIQANFGQIIGLDGLNFGAMPGGVHLFTEAAGGLINIVHQSYTISGGAASHVAAWVWGEVVIQSDTITLTGTPAFSQGFVQAQWSGGVFAAFSTFTGAATGPRYNLASGGWIDISGSTSHSFLPGNAAGICLQGMYGSSSGGNQMNFCGFTLSKNDAGANPAGNTNGTLVEIVGADGALSALEMDGIGNQALLYLRRANGTGAAPTALANNDIIGGIQWLGRGSTVYGPSQNAAILASASENWTDANHGTRLSFYTTPNAGGSPTEQWRVGPSGSLFNPAATGGDPAAAGVINAQGLQINGSAVPSLSVPNTWTANQTLTVNQDANTAWTITNSSAGTSATSSVGLSNGTQGNTFGLGGTGYTGIAILQARGYLRAASSPEVIATGGANAVIIAPNDTERARVLLGLMVGTTTDPGAGIVNVATGFRIGNAATSGRVLRGDGTNFVIAQLGVADLSDGTTGSGAVARATSPVFVTPTLGAASATSINFGGSTLSTYTAGTWTPAFAGTGTAGTFTYSAQVGSYEQIGRMIIARFVLATSSASVSPTGTLNITGLPVTSGATANDNGACSLDLFNGWTGAAGYTQLAANIQPSATVFALIDNGSGKSAVATPASEFNFTGANVQGFCTYHN